MSTHADHRIRTKQAHKPANQQAQSLRSCQAVLAGRIGPLAPSYPTLKRWSAAGRLDKAAEPGREGATRYHLDRLIKILLDLDPQRYAGLAPGAAAMPEGVCPDVWNRRQAAAGSAGQQPPPSAPSPHAASPMAIEALRQQIAQVAAELERLGGALLSRLDKLEAGVANLEATRRMLMNKTDAELTAWRRRAETAEAQLVEAKRQSGPIDTLRISRLLSQVEEHLAAQHRPR